MIFYALNGEKFLLISLMLLLTNGADVSMRILLSIDLDFLEEDSLTQLLAAD